MKAQWLCREINRHLVRIVARRPADFLIGPVGDPYMRRWWVIPRNKLLNIYLHEIRHDDDDRALHDHPWVSLSFMLDGKLSETYATSYVEAAADGLPRLTKAVRSIAAGDIVFRRAKFAHRLELLSASPAWTLFITGPSIRKWGFLCPHSWRYWRDFVDSRDTGRIGRGCE